MMDQPFTFGSDVFPGLAKLVEECGEVLQIAGKLITVKGDNNYWEGRDIHQDLSEELADLLAAVTFTIDNSGLDQTAIYDRSGTKLRRFYEWHENGDDPIFPPSEIEGMITLIDSVVVSLSELPEGTEKAILFLDTANDYKALKKRVISGELPATMEQRRELKAASGRLLEAFGVEDE